MESAGKREWCRAVRRRLSDANFFGHVFIGKGIDIGGAPDPLGLCRELHPSMRRVRVWDLNGGNAQRFAGVPSGLRLCVFQPFSGVPVRSI